MGDEENTLDINEGGLVGQHEDEHEGQELEPSDSLSRIKPFSGLLASLAKIEDMFSYHQTWPFHGHPSKGCIRRRKSHALIKCNAYWALITLPAAHWCLSNFAMSTCAAQCLQCQCPLHKHSVGAWPCTGATSKCNKEKGEGLKEDQDKISDFKKPLSRIWTRGYRVTRARTTCSREKQAKRGPECRNCMVGCRWCSELNIWWLNDILQEGWPPSPCTVPRHFW